MPRRSLDLGHWGEDLAARFLQERGYAILARNYRWRRKEVDLVVSRSDTLVFVEVKARRTLTFGPGVLAVTPRKQAEILRVAQVYILRARLHHLTCRFDVIAITCPVAGPPRLEHIEDAFRLQSRTP